MVFSSTILITGCELKNILIQSPIFGDYLGTITVNGTFKVSEEAPLYDDALENPDWPTVAIPEDDALEKCECEYGDVECLINCLESTIQTENQRKKRSDDYYSSDCECGDDDACWEDFLQTGECPLTRPEFECECEDWDKECWTFCLECLQTGVCPDRQLLTANLEEKSIFMLELKWSDEATKIVKLESVGDIDEDCFYEGSYIEDSDR